MTATEVRRRLIRQLRRAYSIELAAASALDGLVDREPGGGLERCVRDHREASHRRRARALERLTALRAGPPAGTGLGVGILAAARGLDRRSARPGAEEQLRQAVLVKQLEVSTYDIVERLAERAGDEATARMAGEARAEDEALVRRLMRTR